MHWRSRAHRRRAYNVPGEAHELTFTCYRRFAFLGAERCCEWLADSIEKARQQFDFDLWAYVFMPEHVHLIVYPRQPVYDVRLILQAIKEPVGRAAIGYLREHSPAWLPRIAVQHGRRVRYHFWQEGGGYDRNINEANTLMFMIDYLHQNPVRRGLVEHAWQWKWSSAGWYEGLQPNRLRPDPIDPNLLPADLSRPRGRRS